MLTDTFLEYLRSERNRSVRTIDLYGRAVAAFELFFESLDEGLTWNQITADVIREWVIYMLESEKKSAATVNLNLSALRTFYHYLMIVGEVSANPAQKVQGPKKGKTLPSFVKVQEMDRLLASMEGEDFSTVRDRTIILMLYMTGMRRAELVGLRDEDIRLDDMVIKVTGKRNKQRLIPFGEELRQAVANYVSVRNATFPVPEGDHFFLGKRGKNINAGDVAQTVKRNLSLVTTLRRCSPHVLRHTFATVMLNGGSDLQSIQKLLGHESLSTTEVYTHLSFEEMKKEYQCAHPRTN